MAWVIVPIFVCTVYNLAQQPCLWEAGRPQTVLVNSRTYVIGYEVSGRRKGWRIAPARIGNCTVGSEGFALFPASATA